MCAIPRPRWSKSRTRAGSGTDLLKAMPGWAEPDFQKFKEHVMCRAQAYKLNTHAYADAQDPAKWQQLLTDCRIHFPALDKFEGQWPLEIYYTKWTYWRQLKSKNRKTGPANHSRDQRPEEGSDDESHSRKQKRGTDKENEQIRTVHSSPRSTAEATKTRPRPPVTDGSGSSGQPLASMRPPNLRPTQVDHETHFDRGSPDGEHNQDSLLSLKEADSRLNHSAVTLPRSLPQKFYWSSCVLCGSEPQVAIPASETAQLKKYFDGRTDLLRILALLGVVADHHLCALVRLSDRVRHDFLHGAALKGRLTYVEKIEILDLFDRLNLNGNLTQSSSTFKLEGGRKVRLMGFDRPPVELENMLADYRAGYTNVMRHMGVTDEKEYFEIVDLIEEQILGYLDVASPFEEQEEAQLDALVDSICKEKPSLRKFHDFWPIDVHIRRFLSARHVGLPRTPRESLPGLTGSVPTAPPHECPLLRAHPHLRVPPSLAALLGDIGMGELGPAFLLLGIRSENQFASIVTSARMKAQFVAELSTGAGGLLTRCSEFQRIMMGWVVERV